jgi:hypothetical protein
MEVRFLKVTYARLSERVQKPKIIFDGGWLASAGFETDSLVMAEFSMGEAVFRLCDLSKDSYYDLICASKMDGRRLLRVRPGISNGKQKPVLEVRGNELSGFGFSIGVRIAVIVEPGVIQAKVIDTGIFTDRNFPAAM